MPSASLQLVIPAGTLKASSAPVTAKANISDVRITGAYFQFPSGCQYLVELQLLISEGNMNRLIVPTVGGADALDYIAFDSASGLFLPIGIDVRAPATLTANGWNEDAANSHWIKVLIAMESLK